MQDAAEEAVAASHQPKTILASLSYLVLMVLMMSGAFSVVIGAPADSLMLLVVGYFSFLGGWWISVFVHEMGHVIAGCRAGMAFRQAHVGPVCVSRTNGKFEFFFSKRTFFGGFAYMTLPELGDAAKTLRAFILGGPVATICFSIALGVVLSVAYKMLDALELISLGALFFSSLWVIPGSAIPRVSKGQRTDALLLRELAKSGPEMDYVLASFLIYKESSAGIRARDWTRSAVETLIEKPLLETDRLAGLVLAYHYFRDVDESSNWRTYFDQAKETVNREGRNVGFLADVVWLDAAFVAADSDDNVLEAGELLAKATSKAEVLDFSRQLTIAAIETAQGRVAEGESKLRETERALIRQRSRTGCNIEQGLEFIARLREKLHNPDLQTPITSRTRSLPEISPTPGSEAPV